jgi:hypothetical protein
MFEIFEKLKVGLEQITRTNFHGSIKQGLACEQSSQSVNNFTEEKSNRLQLLLDEAVRLSIKICVADAVHDNMIAEKVKDLQSRSLPLLDALKEQVRNIPDRASALRCRRACEQLMEEVRRDVLSMEADLLSTSAGASANRATVSEPPARTLPSAQTRKRTHIRARARAQVHCARTSGACGACVPRAHKHLRAD